MKNKGFTLIELLAVIVILAIIAVIAIPRILNVVEEAKKGAAESSALGYIDAVEKQIMINATSHAHDDITDNTYPVPLDPKYGVTVKGKEPDDGEILIENGKVKEAQLTISGYIVICQNDRCRVTDKVGEVNTSPLASISITTKPTKREYATGEKLDVTGMVVTATYENGDTKVVNSSLTYSPAANSTLQTPGNNTITVSYKEKNITKTDTYSVYVDSYTANRVAVTMNADTSKGGTVTENDGEYTISGQAILRSSETLNLTTVTLYAEVNNMSRYYTSSSIEGSFSGLIIGTGNSGAYTQDNCFGLADGWGTDVIDAFTGSGGYPQISKSLLQPGWNRIAITYDGSTLKLYLNGEVKATYGSATFKNTKLYVGGWNDAPYSASGNIWGFVNGTYRNIRVYNVALPANQL